jgi:hypothetical protein
LEKSGKIHNYFSELQSLIMKRLKKRLLDGAEWVFGEQLRCFAASVAAYGCISNFP